MTSQDVERAPVGHGQGPWNAYKYMAMRDLDGDGRPLSSRQIMIDPQLNHHELQRTFLNDNES